MENISLYLILGFLFHLMGDYLFQNSWMAEGKTKRFFPAFVHATIYSIPFLFITSIQFWLILYITHYFIDRYRLAIYWIKFRENNWKSTNFGFSNETPQFLSMWLLFITDNTIHLLINSTCIYLSNSLWTVTIILTILEINPMQLTSMVICMYI